MPVNPVKAPDDKLAVPSVKSKCSRASYGYAPISVCNTNISLNGYCVCGDSILTQRMVSAEASLAATSPFRVVVPVTP